MKKLFNKVYKRKSYIPYIISLLLYGLCYFIVSGDIMRWFGKSGLLLFTVVLMTLVLTHTTLILINWKTIEYGFGEI